MDPLRSISIGVEEDSMYTLREAFDKQKIIPNRDILNNTITENSFAVGFNAVINGRADEIYNDPKKFFALTHLTKNLQGIISQVLLRAQRGEGSPLLVLDTTFGGGKTHTLVALFHLFKQSLNIEQNPEVKKILNEIDLKSVPEVALVAIDGHSLSSVQREGEVRTIWGEMARQLGKYEMMEVYDQNLRRPDYKSLEQLFRSIGKPVIILLDELVNYLKDAHAEKETDEEGFHLPETTVAFFHTLTDVIANSENAMLILTLPGTEAAYKKEADLLENYKRTIREISGREAAFTVPMERSEIYDVIRKRLFDRVDPSTANSIAEEVLRFYSGHPEHFSRDILSLEYREKMIKSYPFHPLLIDLLYERIATIPDFQKTRSMLRILSHVVKNIYQHLDEVGQDKIITPSLLDLNDQALLQEFTSKIARNEFQNVISSDIVNDEVSAKCQKLDRKPAYGQMTRIATSIYLYSLIGTTKEASLGCSQNELILATASEGIAYPKDITNDALSLENTLWYIYNKTGKYFFSVEVNLNKVISDEMQEVDPPQYNQEIKTRLRKMLASDFFDVWVWDHDVRNPHKPTLVVTNHAIVKTLEQNIPGDVRSIIEREGTSFRTKKNLMFVLVAHEDRIERMVEAARRYRAINKLKGEQRTREDIKSYGNKIDELLKEADANLNLAIERCYSLIYYPRGTDVRSVTVANGYEGAKRYPDKIYQALKKANKIVETLLPSYIVDRVISTRDEITIRDLWSSFEEAPMHMLPASKEVVLSAVLQGVDERMFALYTGGIGDLQVINAENYKRIGEQFFFGNAPSGSPKEGHYLLTKDLAQGIRGQLENLAGSGTSGEIGGGEYPSGSTGTLGGRRQQPLVKTEELTDPGLFAEYHDWMVKDLSFDFSNIRLFYPIRESLSTLLLGITGVTFSVEVRSRLMHLSIRETAVTDTNELLDAIAKVSGMFDEALEVSLTMTYGEPPKVDEDFADSLSGLAKIQNELSFRAHLEKAGGGPAQYEH